MADIAERLLVALAMLSHGIEQLCHGWLPRTHGVSDSRLAIVHESLNVRSDRTPEPAQAVETSSFIASEVEASSLKQICI